MSNTFRKLAVDNGIADSRAFSIEMALSAVHTAIGQLDSQNLARFNQLFPGVTAAANLYASTQEGLNAEFQTK